MNTTSTSIRIERLLFFVAVIGWITSAAIHIIALVSDLDITGGMSAIWLLDGGAFAV